MPILEAGCETHTRDAHLYRSIIFVRTGAMKKIQVEEIEYVAGRPCRDSPPSPRRHSGRRCVSPSLKLLEKVACTSSRSKMSRSFSSETLAFTAPGNLSLSLALPFPSPLPRSSNRRESPGKRLFVHVLLDAGLISCCTHPALHCQGCFNFVR